jgi:hypothetical protein
VIGDLFDVNCILGKWPEGGPTLDDRTALLAAMDRLGIGRALVRHTLGWHYHAPYGNELLAAELAGNERLVPCWAALPPGADEMGPPSAWLAALAASNVRAVCLYPAGQGYPLADWQCAALLGPLAEHRLLLLLELGEIGFPELHWLCAGYPTLRVVLLSTGYRVLRPLYALLEAHPNLYLDTSSLTNFGALEALCARFGADRLLFGTGQPRSDGAGMVAALHYAALEMAQIEAIGATNLEHLLGEVQW